MVSICKVIEPDALSMLGAGISQEMHHVLNSNTAENELRHNKKTFWLMNERLW